MSASPIRSFGPESSPNLSEPSVRSLINKMSPVVESEINKPKIELSETEIKQTFEGLDNRKQELMEYLAKGVKFKKIAENLKTSEGVIKNRVWKLCQQFGFKSSRQLSTIWGKYGAKSSEKMTPPVNHKVNDPEFSVRKWRNLKND